MCIRYENLAGLTCRIRGQDRIILSYPLFGVWRDWISRCKFYFFHPGEAFYPIEYGIKQSHIRGGIILSCADIRDNGENITLPLLKNNISILYPYI